MYSKTLVLLGVFAVVALAVGSPVQVSVTEVELEAPKEIQTVTLKETVIPPPNFLRTSTFCYMDEAQEACKAREDQQERENDQNELAGLNEWISGMSASGKQEWRSQYPEAASRYDQLNASG
ncbi:unnamed protein product [Orchesella dallaii]|uniref:Uncharacterized protein n=1 Tax=Orchesella dallaii TaxID=48710 RepID=A0ABP1RQ64_9HEXA